MKSNKVTKPLFDISNRNAIVENFKLIKSDIFAVNELFADRSFENLNIFIELMEHLIHRLDAYYLEET